MAKSRVHLFFRKQLARIVANFPGNLAVTDIDRINFARTRWSKQSVNPSGRRTDIHRN